MPVKKFFYLYLLTCLSVILPFAVQGEEPESANPCLITNQEIIRTSTQQDITLVDVRNASDYQIYQIPDSINIKLHELKAKTFLKGKRLVLIGYGYDTESLLKACKTLDSFGFKTVQVLRNGIAGWAMSKGRSIDKPSIIRSVFYINPEDISQIQNNDRVLVIDLSSQKSTPLSDYFQHITTIDTSKKDATKQISKILTSNSQQYDYMIVVDEDGQGYASLYILNQNEQHLPVMFLSKGINGLYDFEVKQAAMANKKEFTLQNLKGCEN